MRCPWCGSEDVRKLIGDVWVCRDCLREFTADGEPLLYRHKFCLEQGWEDWVLEREIFKALKSYEEEKGSGKNEKI